MSYRYENPGRSPGKLAILVTVWAALLLLRLFLDAAWWIVLPLALLTLPALRDWLTDRPAWLTLDADEIAWAGGARSNAVPLERIGAVRIDIRLDFSTRATLMLDDGRRLRLPYEVIPPEPQFRAELERLGLKVDRRPFSLL